MVQHNRGDAGVDDVNRGSSGNGSHVGRLHDVGYSQTAVPRPTERSVNYPVKAPQFAEAQTGIKSDASPAPQKSLQQSLYESGPRTDLKGAGAAAEDGQAINKMLNSPKSKFNSTGTLSMQERDQMFKDMDQRPNKQLMGHMNNYANGNGRYKVDMSREFDAEGHATDKIDVTDSKIGSVINTYTRAQSPR